MRRIVGEEILPVVTSDGDRLQQISFESSIHETTNRAILCIGDFTFKLHHKRSRISDLVHILTIAFEDNVGTIVSHGDAVINDSGRTREVKCTHGKK